MHHDRRQLTRPSRNSVRIDALFSWRNSVVHTASLVDLASSGRSCADALEVGFWGHGSEGHWESDSVRVAYYVPPDMNVLLVTYVDGTVEGVSYETNTYEDGINVDGAELQLNSSFSERHVVQVALYHDENGNGQFEREVDKPCLDDGEVIQAGPRVIDFSEF